MTVIPLMRISSSVYRTIGPCKAHRFRLGVDYRDCWDMRPTGALVGLRRIWGFSPNHPTCLKGSRIWPILQVIAFLLGQPYLLLARFNGAGVSTISTYRTCGSHVSILTLNRSREMSLHTFNAVLRRKIDSHHPRSGSFIKIAQVGHLGVSVPPEKYGGSERVLSYLTEELVRLGHDVTLFASGDSTTTAKLRPMCARALNPTPVLNW